MKINYRKGAFLTPNKDSLIERDGQIGYVAKDGSFVSLCKVDDKSSVSAQEETSRVQEFLNATPNFREAAAASLVSFSVTDDAIYSHFTVDYYKQRGPGSRERYEAIRTALTVIGTPEALEDWTKNPPNPLAGAELDAWAKRQVAQQEFDIATLKANGGRAPNSNSGIVVPQLRA